MKLRKGTDEGNDEVIHEGTNQVKELKRSKKIQIQVHFYVFVIITLFAFVVFKIMEVPKCPNNFLL